MDLTHTHNGGVLTTGGNLVAQGRLTGELSIYAADTGEKIWSFDAQNGIMAQPISYLVDGRQYITLLVGWRGSTHTGDGKPWHYRTQRRRVLTFTLDGEEELPAIKNTTMPIVEVPGFEIDSRKAAQGNELYHRTCFVCHGTELRAGGAAPDLRRSGMVARFDSLLDVVHNGALQSRGMPQYGEFTPEQVENLQHYIRKAAREAGTNE